MCLLAYERFMRLQSLFLPENAFNIFRYLGPERKITGFSKSAAFRT